PAMYGNGRAIGTCGTFTPSARTAIQLVLRSETTKLSEAVDGQKASSSIPFETMPTRKCEPRSSVSDAPNPLVRANEFKKPRIAQIPRNLRLFLAAFCRRFFFSAGATQDVRHRVIAFLACVFENLSIGV